MDRRREDHHRSNGGRSSRGYSPDRNDGEKSRSPRHHQHDRNSTPPRHNRHRDPHTSSRWEPRDNHRHNRERHIRDASSKRNSPRENIIMNSHEKRSDSIPSSSSSSRKVIHPPKEIVLQHARTLPPSPFPMCTDLIQRRLQRIALSRIHRLRQQANCIEMKSEFIYHNEQFHVTKKALQHIVRKIDRYDWHCKQKT